MHHCAFAKREHDASSTLPVLLIHGYVCNSGYWQRLSQVLSRASVNHYAIDLEPVFGSIDDYVPLIHRAVEAICAETGQQQVIIVAHSMGGLAARAYLRAQGSVRIAQVITLGTPHYGTALASRGPGRNSRQMEWNGESRYGESNAWLAQLAASESAETRALITSIYSYQDNIVAPQLSSHLEGANNIALTGMGHVALALNPTVQQHVLEQIRRVS
jgi:triacylglycerol esterase/lipase EstA (alpha/beta hydrolase family)